MGHDVQSLWFRLCLLVLIPDQVAFGVQVCMQEAALVSIGALSVDLKVDTRFAQILALSIQVLFDVVVEFASIISVTRKGGRVLLVSKNIPDL